MGPPAIEHIVLPLPRNSFEAQLVTIRLKRTVILRRSFVLSGRHQLVHYPTSETNQERPRRMSIKSALIAEGDLLFLLVAVPQPVLDDHAKAEQTVRFFQRRLSGLPTALVTRDAF